MIWLSISLFCNKSNWHILLANGIKPFITTNSFVEFYTIEFNYLSGENIRLSILTNQSIAPQVAKNANDYFKTYFLNANLAANQIKLSGKGVFIPFKENTIQFGLYSPIKIKSEEKNDYIFPICLSSILMQTLKDDVIDDETIITFAFYLRMGLIKVMNLIKPQFIESLKKDTNIEHRENNINYIEFEKTKDILIEITQDVLYTEDNKALPDWFENWLMACRTHLETKTSHDVNTEVIYNEMVYLIYKHLGISSPVASMLSFFIEKSLFNYDIQNK